MVLLTGIILVILKRSPGAEALECRGVLHVTIVLVCSTEFDPNPAGLSSYNNLHREYCSGCC